MPRRFNYRAAAEANLYERMAANRANAPMRASYRYVPQAPTVGDLRKAAYKANRRKSNGGNGG